MRFSVLSLSFVIKYYKITLIYSAEACGEGGPRGDRGVEVLLALEDCWG